MRQYRLATKAGVLISAELSNLIVLFPHTLEASCILLSLEGGPCTYFHTSRALFCEAFDQARRQHYFFWTYKITLFNAFTIVIYFRLLISVPVLGQETIMTETGCLDIASKKNVSLNAFLGEK